MHLGGLQRLLRVRPVGAPCTSDATTAIALGPTGDAAPHAATAASLPIATPSVPATSYDSHALCIPRDVGNEPTAVAEAVAAAEAAAAAAFPRQERFEEGQGQSLDLLALAFTVCKILYVFGRRGAGWVASANHRLFATNRVDPPPAVCACDGHNRPHRCRRVGAYIVRRPPSLHTLPRPGMSTVRAVW